ncbi:Clr5 domain-containing protein [Fusarium sp. LHS14.1]|nr:Clr5 domain-containing protein [Fusarium sp. LHS14.1]
MTTPDSQQRPHSFNSTTRSLNNMAGSRSIAPEEWESLKAIISDLYLNQKMTLSGVMRLMEDEHGFRASKAQYVRKLKNWGMGKNSTNQKWKVAAQQVHKRKLEGKETEIVINGRLIPWKKLRKETARYANSQSDIGGSDIPTDLSTGVVARTPPGEFSAGIQTIHIPWFQFQAFVESSSTLNLLHPCLGQTLISPTTTVECLTVDAGPFFMNLSSAYNPTEWERSLGFYSGLGTEPLPSFPNDELNLSLGWDPSSVNEEQSQASSLLDPSCREARGLLGECLDESIDPDNPNYFSRISSSLEEITIDRHDGDLVHHLKRLSTASGQEAVFQLLRYTVYLSSNNLLSDKKTDKLLRWIIESGHLWTLESLLGSTLPTTKIFASNLLVGAARLGEVNLVKALLAKGFDPNILAGMPEKRTPLEVAADQ